MILIGNVFYNFGKRKDKRMKKITAYKVNNLSKVDPRFYVEGDHFLTDRSVGILNNGKIKTLQRNENIEAHITNKENPHNVSKDQIGLSDVQNFGISSKKAAELGMSEGGYMTPLRTNQAIVAQVPELEIIQDLVNRVEQLEGGKDE